MLQALQLENTPTQAKVRSGTGADPADAAFAGLMAQASCASMAPARPVPDPPREDRSSPREVAAPQRSEAPASTKAMERLAEEGARTKAPGASGDPAKAAAAIDQDETQPTGSHGASSAQEETGADQVTPKLQPDGAKAPIQAQVSLPAGSQGPQVIPEPGIPGQGAPEQGTPEPDLPEPMAPAVKGIQTGKQDAPAAEAVVGADAALKGLSQEVLPAKGGAGTPVKAALTELMYLPKGDLQAPRPSPGSIKTPPTDGPKLAIPVQTGESGDPKAGSGLPEAEAASEKISLKPPVVEEGFLLRPETLAQQIQVPKHGAPSLETTTVPMAEGVKASQPTVPVESAAAARPSPVFAQVEGSIRWILQNKAQSAELQLHPESLGRMVIQLRVEGQEVHARLWASDPTSLAVLQDHKAFLESSLREQGLNLGSFDLHSGARGDGAQTAFQERAIGGAPAHLSRPELEQEMPTDGALVSAEAHRIEVFA